ncbi:MAG: terminase small subunit [Candidatus Bipolaricaulia bacterium]
MSRDLTEKQQKFVEALPQVADIKEAAEQAGYSDTHPSHIKSDVLSSDKVRKALMEEMAVESLTGKLKLMDLEELAIEGLREIIAEGEAPHTIKLGAINSVLDRNENLKRMFGLDLEGQIDHDHELSEADQELQARLEQVSGKLEAGSAED